jgi:hypothetical protein
MKTSAVIVSRNDNYGGNLIERASYCINSSISTYDEVIYVDWNSEHRSLLHDIKQNIKFKKNLYHFVIDPENAKLLTGGDPHAQKCCEVLGRNIGLCRATGDWIVSTNIDIIAPEKQTLVEKIKTFNENCFYAITRIGVDLSTIQDFNSQNGYTEYSEINFIRNFLMSTTIKERNFQEKLFSGDDYSIINCCGDFQIAHRNIWHTIRGMEEELIYPLYADTNVQKKAIKHGFQLKAIYDPPLFHINHGRGGGGFLDGINRKCNDHFRAIINQETTQNSETWGFSNIDIECELY